MNTRTMVVGERVLLGRVTVTSVWSLVISSPLKVGWNVHDREDDRSQSTSSRYMITGAWEGAKYGSPCIGAKIKIK